MAASWKAMKAWMDRDELLKRLNLEERSPAGDFFGGLGLFAMGVLVGAGLGVLFAPRRGDEMRQAVGEAWRNRTRKDQDFSRDLGAEAAVPPMGGGR
jgi:hypothetical protein